MKKSILFLFFLCSLPHLSAQNIDISKLTPQQIAEYKKYSGTLNQNNSSKQQQFELDERIYTEDSLRFETDKKEDDKKLKVFGAKIFDREKISFEPNINLPTPVNYVLGTNDELIVDISGLYDVSYKVKVSPDGFIRIPNAGMIKVGGLSIEKASRDIRKDLAKYYSGISSGETKINVSLGNIRSIKVSIIGEASYPGTYTLPSLATVFNALYACGGPGEIGSMRNIKVIRNEKTLATVDFYEFLMTGNLKNNIVLQDNDVIIIEANQVKVIVDGAINRRGIYETKPGESLQDLITYAGGFREDANRSLINIFRYNGNRRTVIDIPEKYASTSLIKPGDSIYIAKIEDIYDNRVVLTGAVRRPGGYAVDADLTVKKLIEKAGGVTDNAFINMATIIRQKSNQIPEMISFNLGKVLQGENTDIQLFNNDSLKIDSVSNFMEEQFVSIEGEVIEPGKYVLKEKLTVKDLIYRSKGFTEKASTENIQLIRIIKDPNKMDGGNKTSINISFKLDKDLNIEEGTGDIPLENGDLIIVRPVEGIEPIRIASIEGEVRNPGFYNIENKNIKVSDLIKMSGGFTKYAFVGGAYLIRNENRGASQNSMNNILSRNLRKILQSSSEKDIDVAVLNKMKVNNVEELNALDTLSNMANYKEIQDLLNSEGVVSLNLNEIIRDPGSYRDILIEDGDVLFVPKKSQTVKVIGEVMYPSFVVHSAGRRLKEYITASGGFSNKALKKNTFVLHPNGRVIGTRTFLGFRIYPNVVAGSIIVVPKKPIDLTNKMNAAEIVTMSTSVTSMMALIYSMVR
jgi:protein involved in polysaccharide export with SLBB domain